MYCLFRVGFLKSCRTARGEGATHTSRGSDTRVAAAAMSSGPSVASSASTPNDAEAMRALLRSMGVEHYEPRVLHQLLEYMQSYCTEIFADSALYAEHAGRPGQLECEDVQLSARLKALASQPHAPLLMEQMARIRNQKQIPPLTVPNIQLPNPKLCLVEENWQLEPRQTEQPVVDEGGSGDASTFSSARRGGRDGGSLTAPSSLTRDGRVAFTLPPRGASGSQQQQQQQQPAPMATD